MKGLVLAALVAITTAAGAFVQKPRDVGGNSGTLLPILQILDNSKLSGSLSFLGSCDMHNFPHFPRFRPPSATQISPVQALREIVAEDPAITVSREKTGIIRMKERGAPTDMLGIKIKHVSFSYGVQKAAFTPNEAMDAISHVPEIVAFMKKHGIEWPTGARAARGNSALWPTNYPHISGSLDNITLSQALDYILKTFPGIWIYMTCPKTAEHHRIAYFQFYQLSKR